VSPVKSCQAFQNSLVSLLEIYFRDRVKRCRLMLRANGSKSRSLRQQHCKFLFRMNVEILRPSHHLAALEVISFQFWQRAVLTAIVNNKMLSFNIYHITLYSYLSTIFYSIICEMRGKHVSDKNLKIW